MLATIIKDLVELPRWLKLALAGVLALLAYGAWERHVGETKCEAKVAQAQASADAKADELQRKLDARAAEDAGLQAAAAATAAPYAPIKFGCQLSTAELAQVRERIK